MEDNTKWNGHSKTTKNTTNKEKKMTNKDMSYKDEEGAIYKISYSEMQQHKEFIKKANETIKQSNNITKITQVFITIVILLIIIGIIIAILIATNTQIIGKIGERLFCTL